MKLMVLSNLRVFLSRKSRLDEEEFSILYQEQVKPVYNFVCYRLGYENAEDITSEIFSRAWAKRASYDPDKGTPKTWLWTIARRVVIDRFRNRRPVLVQLSERLAAANKVTAEVERREEWREIREALAHLQPVDQEIISLRFGAGETNRAIAAILGLTEVNVAQRLRRALRTMRDYLDGK